MGKRKQYQFAGIYQFLNLENGKRYIGQAQNVANRLYEHKRHRNLHGTSIAFYNAINKYGWDAFEFSIIEKVDDSEKLNEREQFWIDIFQSFKRENGYNICREANTTRGYKYSEKTRKRLSEWAKSRVAEKNTFYGKTHSEESKRKIGEANAKYVRTSEMRKRMSEGQQKLPKKKIAQIDHTTKEIIKIWDSSFEIQKELGLHQSSLSLSCRGKQETCGGFEWRYAEEIK